MDKHEQIMAALERIRALEIAAEKREKRLDALEEKVKNIDDISNIVERLKRVQGVK